MWVFGYGSLVWKVDFPYSQRVVGYIKGYVRRFWQASVDHRGVPGKPGRVVTIVPSKDPEDQVWGVAYEIPPNEEMNVIKQLNVREQRYDNQRRVAVHSPSGQPISHDVLVFVGSHRPELFLGDAPLDSMAHQIAYCHGPSGANSEYLFQLARFMRDEVPQTLDDHLFQLEAAVNELLTKSREDQPQTDHH